MVTAVELGPDTCVLVRAALRRGEVRVSAVETLDPNKASGVDAFTSALKEARRVHRLPRRARVVLWGVKDGAGPRDAAVQPQLAPFTAAGFQVERVVSPCDALAALARIRTPRPDAAIAWVAVDRAGVAMVVARPGELLYSHAFNWNSTIGARGSQARLLQRYSLVSYLAPELKRAAARAREKGARLEAVITCGNLPDLRSLTMPLIEELDLEVETLDSLDGLDVPLALKDRAADLAPAIRLACAGIAARPVRMPHLGAPQRTRIGAPRALVAAALIAVAAGMGWLWYSQRGPAAPASTQNAAPHSTTTSPVPVTTPAPLPRVDASSTAATRGTVAAPVVASERRAQPAPARRPQPQQREALLDEPLPKVSTILVSDDRRLAMIDGHVLSVGDAVGHRVISAIEPRAVVFREPSGAQVRVRLGGSRELP